MGKNTIAVCLCLLSLVSTHICAASTAIDAGQFFTNVDVRTVDLSPSGKRAAILRNTESSHRIDLYDTESQRESTLLDLAQFDDGETSIRVMTWLDDRHIAAQFVSSREGVKDLLDTRKTSSLVIIQVPDSAGESPLVYRVRTNGWLVDPLVSEPGQFLFAKSSVYSKVYRLEVSKLNRYGQKLSKLVKVDGGQFTPRNEVASVKGYATRWFVNSTSGQVTGVVFYSDPNTLSLASYNGQGDEERLSDWNVGEEADDEAKRLIPILATRDPNVFYSIDTNEDEQRSVYSVDFSSQQETLVYESRAYKIIDLIQDKSSLQLIGVKVIDEGSVRSVFFGAVEQQEDRFGPGSLDVVISQSLDSKQSLSYREAHNQPGTFVWHDGVGEPHVLGHYYPHFSKGFDTRMEVHSTEVDGLSIPYLLTLPADKPAPSFPLVVMPHGGPIGVSDNPYYDAATQLFAANGYAVLRVNYRGSSGYSQALRDAGKLQWGSGILHDIMAATREVMARDDIGKACIVGASYGGYAALSLILREPDTFRCAASLSGVSDINLYLNHSHRRGKRDKWLRENVGDTLTDYDALKDASPLYHLDTLSRPLMVMHGDEDGTVDVEHAFRVRHILEKYQKPLVFHVYEGQGHSFSEPEKAADAFNRILGFIAQSLHSG